MEQFQRMRQVLQQEGHEAHKLHGAQPSFAQMEECEKGLSDR